MNVQASSWNYEPLPDEDLARLGTDPIPARPYYDPDWFAAEREAIFKRTWLQLGHVCEIAEPGAFIVRPVEVAGASILITRAKDGEIRAFHNVCTHRGTQLTDETDGVRSSFTCRYHAWTFGSDGELRSAPDFERFYVAREDCALRKVAVDVCAGLIFVNLDPSPAQPLREFLGVMAERLETLPVARATTFTEYVYEIEANWKLTYDNFQETYHLRFIHSRTGGAGFGPDNPFLYPVRYDLHGPHSEKTIWSNPAPVVPPIEALALGKGRAFTLADGVSGPNDKQYFQIFPNFFILGAPSQHFSHVVMPISATKSRGVVRLYFVGDDRCASRRFAREYAIGLARDIHSEDVDVIAAGQRGLSSGALEHINFQEQEVLCRHTYRSVAERVEAWRRSQQGAAHG